MDDNTPLWEAREWVEEHRDDGVHCPCCDQMAKNYRRAFPSASARVLIALNRKGAAEDYVYLPPVLDTLTRTAAQGGYGTFCHHWGLIEQEPGIRADGSNRVGWWCLTTKGIAFVHDRMKVPKFVTVYNNTVLGFDGPDITIRDALGHRFNYEELMRGE